MNVGLIQMDIQLGQPAENIQRARGLIEQAVEAGAEVLLLPELWTTGFALPQLDEMLAHNGQTAFDFMAQSAKQHSVWLVGGSVAERGSDGKIYNCAAVYNPAGKRAAVYRKMHLFGLMNEDQYLASGNEIADFRISEWHAGLIICYDLRFPELTRALTMRGSHLIFVPAQWPAQRLDHWRVLLQARAIENQSFVVACNTVGQKGKDHFPGSSMVIDPWGQILYEAGDKETVAVVELNGEEITRVRQTMSVLSDRRPDCY